jgi:tetratricopeptide (TPR) repeat protein
MSLRVHLTALEATGLIRLADAQPELEYLFRHALVQDAAYASILRADRKRLHLAVGEAFEQLYPDQVASRELAPLLARHFAEAGDDVRALKYFTLAGDAASKVYANAEAIVHYTRALEIAKRTPTPRPSPIGESSDGAPAGIGEGVLLHLYLHLGRVLEISGRYDEAIANYTEMETLARARGDRPLELAALMELTKLRAIPSAKYDPPQGRVLAERTLALAHDLGDRAAEARVLWILLILNIYSGNDLLQAIPYGEQSQALARELNLRELLAFVLNDIWYPYVGTGQIPRAWSALEEAGQLWRELGNIPMLAANVSYLSNMHIWVGEPEQAITRGDEAFHLAGSVGNLEGQATSRFVIGLAYAELGQFEKALSAAEEGMVSAEAFNLLAILSGTRAELGWAYGQLGAVDHGLELARRACAVAEEKIAPLQGWTRSIMARLHLLKGEATEAEAALAGLESYRHVQRKFGFIPPYWIGRALAEGELALAQNDHTHALAITDNLYADLLRFGIRLLRPDVLYLKSRVLLAQDRVDEAHVILTEARTLAEALTSRRTLWRILSALSELETLRGNHAEAQALRPQAREIIRFIADHTPADPSTSSGQSLRASFLNLPDVRAVTHP